MHVIIRSCHDTAAINGCPPAHVFSRGDCSNRRLICSWQRSSGVIDLRQRYTRNVAKILWFYDNLIIAKIAPSR
jgi:hypothetical protein